MFLFTCHLLLGFSGHLSMSWISCRVCMLCPAHETPWCKRAKQHRPRISSSLPKLGNWRLWTNVRWVLVSWPGVFQMRKQIVPLKCKESECRKWAKNRKNLEYCEGYWYSFPPNGKILSWRIAQWWLGQVLGRQHHLGHYGEAWRSAAPLRRGQEYWVLAPSSPGGTTGRKKTKPQSISSPSQPLFSSSGPGSALLASTQLAWNHPLPAGGGGTCQMPAHRHIDSHEENPRPKFLFSSPVNSWILSGLGRKGKTQVLSLSSWFFSTGGQRKDRVQNTNLCQKNNRSVFIHATTDPPGGKARSWVGLQKGLWKWMEGGWRTPGSRQKQTKWGVRCSTSQIPAALPQYVHGPWPSLRWLSSWHGWGSGGTPGASALLLWGFLFSGGLSVWSWGCISRLGARTKPLSLEKRSQQPPSVEGNLGSCGFLAFRVGEQLWSGSSPHGCVPSPGFPLAEVGQGGKEALKFSWRNLGDFKNEERV